MGLISTTAFVHLAPVGHTSGQQGLPGWVRLGTGSVGCVVAHCGWARPELLPAYMAGPDAQLMISEELHW